MHAAATIDVLITLQIAENALDDVVGVISKVPTKLRNAREFARCGGTGDVPNRPVDDILGVLDMTRVRLEASRRAGNARMLAIEACHAMAQCCDCLMMIRLLLHGPERHLPGIDDVIEGQRAQACGHLVTAKEKVDPCAALLALALQGVPGAAD
jgi:hypothetical protein